MKIEKIIINGCSFVHGFDLCFERHNIHPYSMWPEAIKQMTISQRKEFKNERLSGKLKNIFNCEVIDLSHSGENNDFIANKTINYINDNKNKINSETTLVIIGWTEPERLPFYFEDQKLNVTISMVQSYLNVALREPHSDHTEKRIELLKRLLPMQQIWNGTNTMAYITYFRHTSLVFLLQQYLQNYNIRYCFFNSLRSWPLKPNYLSKIENYESYDSLIDWNSWYPYKDISSYNWNWDQDMDDRFIPKTLTAHPTIEAVNIFSKELSEFIRKNY